MTDFLEDFLVAATLYLVYFALIWLGSTFLVWVASGEWQIIPLVWRIATIGALLLTVISFIYEKDT